MVGGEGIFLHILYRIFVDIFLHCQVQIIDGMDSMTFSVELSETESEEMRKGF